MYAMFKGLLDNLIEQFLESLKNCSVFINWIIEVKTGQDVKILNVSILPTKRSQCDFENKFATSVNSK